jgi:hypothetical protein
MGVQALEPAGARLAAEPGIELGAKAPLLLVGALKARPQARVLASALAPALDTARRLDARELRDELRAREPVRRRERLARLVVRRLLGYRRAAEGAADGNAAERPRRASELALDDLPVIHPGRS